VAASCHYQLRRLRQIRRCVGKEVTIRLVLALDISRLDYCNSLLAGLPQSTLASLQRVQNAAARLVFDLGARDHVTASLIQLHWVPVTGASSSNCVASCILFYGNVKRQNVDLYSAFS